MGRGRVIRDIVDIVKEKDPRKKSEKILVQVMFFFIAITFAAIYSNFPQIGIFLNGVDDFSGAYFKHFPEVINIYSYLNIDRPSLDSLVKRYEKKSNNKNELYFSEDVQEYYGKRTGLTYMDYIHALEESGFRLEESKEEAHRLFELENDQYKIIISVSEPKPAFDLSGWGSGNVRLPDERSVYFHIERKVKRIFF
ncbi:MAG: hypothetical protein LBU77_02860 [Clostridiales bacterium]|nr:hypothetical protein [Clostridiales bacterium]